MTAFRVREGFHHDGKGKSYRKGQVLRSDKPLHKLFPNKFDIVASKDKDAKEDATEGASRKKKKSRSAPYEKGVGLEDIGKDVSQRFPDAINQGLRVYQTEDGEFNVTDERDLYAPINKKPMTKAETKKFLTEQS